MVKHASKGFQQDSVRIFTQSCHNVRLYVVVTSRGFVAGVDHILDQIYNKWGFNDAMPQKSHNYIRKPCYPSCWSSGTSQSFLKKYISSRYGDCCI